MPTQPTADLSYINVKIDGISLMVKALHDSSSIGINATGGHFLGNIWSTGDEVSYIPGKVCRVSAVV